MAWKLSPVLAAAGAVVGAGAAGAVVGLAAGAAVGAAAGAAVGLAAGAVVAWAAGAAGALVGVAAKGGLQAANPTATTPNNSPSPLRIGNPLLSLIPGSFAKCTQFPRHQQRRHVDDHQHDG